MIFIYFIFINFFQHREHEQPIGEDQCGPDLRNLIGKLLTIDRQKRLSDIEQVASMFELLKRNHI